MGVSTSQNKTRRHNIVVSIYTGRQKESYLTIMQTCPFDVDLLTPHFYIVKLGFTGVFIFLIFALKHITYIIIYGNLSNV